MLFNSIQFAIFILIVFLLYWLVFNKKVKHQNTFLLAASVFFYACWDWRFLGLLLASTIIGYISGVQTHKSKTPKGRKSALILGIIGLLSLLLFFKYFNFFILSFSELLTTIGFSPHVTTLQIILPVGISFYTFHGLSYILDIYKKKTLPTYNLIDYSLFISFFPLLVAGPIERATHLLPQIKEARQFDYSKTIDGLKQILWGLFKKVVIADSCAGIVNPAFAAGEPYMGSTYALGAILFAVQIYADFSGYSDIAIGTARLLGFDILKNFNYPYFSRNIAEFWRRWHISLTSWFKDYLYIPLGGSRSGLAKTILNVFIIFLVSAFWHGANWTFLCWGVLNTLFILPSVIGKTNRKYLSIVAENKLFPNLKEFAQIIFTFTLASFAWIFFRAESIGEAFTYIEHIFTPTLFAKPDLFSLSIIIMVVLFFVVEWLGRRSNYAIENIGNTWKRPLRWLMYYIIIISILYFYSGGQQFIYFQF